MDRKDRAETIKRSPLAQAFHNLMVSNMKVESGLDSSGLAPQTIDRLTECGIAFHPKRPSVRNIRDFLQIAPEKYGVSLDVITADVSHGHSDFSGIVTIPFRKKTEQGYVHVQSEEALKCAHALFDLFEKDILPKLTPENQKMMVTHISDENFTPLISAAVNGDLALFDRVVALTQKYAPTQFKSQLVFKNDEGTTPLNAALRSHNAPVANRVLDLIEANIKDRLGEQLVLANDGGFTPLLSAIGMGDITLVKHITKLTKEYAETRYSKQLRHVTESGGYSPVLMAVDSGKLVMLDHVLKLLENDAKDQIVPQMTQINRFGITPLMQAVKNGDVRMVKAVDQQLWKLVEQKKISPEDYRQQWLHCTHSAYNMVHQAIHSLDPPVLDLVMHKVADQLVEPREADLMSQQYAQFIDHMQQRAKKQRVATAGGPVSGNFNVFHTWQNRVGVLGDPHEMPVGQLRNALLVYNRLDHEFTNLHMAEEIPPQIAGMPFQPAYGRETPADMYQELTEVWRDRHDGQEWRATVHREHKHTSSYLS